jgi:hypothetical protein
MSFYTTLDLISGQSIVAEIQAKPLFCKAKGPFKKLQ